MIPPVWAARVRLTPELLQKLRERPKEINIKLNVAAGDEAALPSGCNGKTSVMTLYTAREGDLVETVEQYELMSFVEDPSINHACAYKRVDPKAEGGYSIFKTGAIYQKLLVQRLLDETEKDRIKDKHAKFVLESKSRASKLICPELEKPIKKQRLTRLSKKVIAKPSAGMPKEYKHKWTMHLQLPSALTKKQVCEAKEQIEYITKVVGDESPTVPSLYTKNRERDSEKEVVLLTDSKDISTASRDAKSRDFSPSYSEGDGSAIDHSQSANEMVTAISDRAGCADAASIGEQIRSESVVGGNGKSDVGLNFCPDTIKAACGTTRIGCNALLPKNELSVDQAEPIVRKREVNMPQAIKSISSGVEVKRARVRSALVLDRVKNAFLLDMSGFPSSVVQICEQLVNYHGRSIILDKSDYDSIVDTSERFQQYWQLLDKAYSIGMIKMEGVHLQLEIASSVFELQGTRITASTLCEKEGLLVVRDAMVSVQNILKSLQSSICRFDMKLASGK